MSFTDDLKDILSRQQEQLDALAQSIRVIEQTDLHAENERLRQANDQLTRDTAHFQQENKTLSEESKRLSAALHEQLVLERLGILRRSKEQMLFYFGRTGSGIRDRLTELEEKYRKLLTALKDSAERDIARAEPLLKDKLDETAEFYQRTLLEMRAMQDKKEQAVQEAMLTEMDALRGEALPSGPVTDRLRRFNMEMRFGTKIVNIIGILLILLGVVFGLQYTWVNLLRANELKAAAAYTLGLLFLVGGELLQPGRRKKAILVTSPDPAGNGVPSLEESRTETRVIPKNNAFAVGVTAGGLGILFASTAISYFTLHILPAGVAVGMCVVVTMLSFLLSVRYNARTIACLAVVGGYLPLTALPGDAAAVHSFFVYIFLLNMLALFIATQKKWPVLNGLCFTLYTFCTLVLLAFYRARLNTAFIAIYLMVHFLLFLAVVLVYPAMRGKDKRLSAALPGVSLIFAADFVLLSANTVLHCAFLYAALNTGKIPFAYNGVLAIAFCVIYGVAARLSERFLPHETRVRALFGLTALAFAILVVPFQFGLDRLLVGWLAEGVLLLGYGVLRKEKWFERAGIGVMLLATVSFAPQVSESLLTLIFRGSRRMGEQGLFFVHFTLFMLGLAGITAVYYYTNREHVMFERTPKGRIVNLFSYTIGLTGLGYVLYAAAFVYKKAVNPVLDGSWLAILLIMCGFIYGAGIKYMKFLRGRAAVWLSSAVVIICAAATLSANMERVYHPVRPVASMGLLIVFNLFALAAVYDGVRSLRALANREWRPIIVSLYALALVTQTLTVQYGYSTSSILLSAVGMLASLCWIIYGFLRRNRVTRLFGLGFSLFSTTKLFFMDLQFLENEMRIASYFVFGAVLLGISFVYQHFDRKLTRRL